MRTTPAWPATASKTSSAPASDPVWASAAARLAAEPPILNMTMGLPAFWAPRQASRKSSGSLTVSTKETITLVSSSAVK